MFKNNKINNTKKTDTIYAILESDLNCFLKDENPDYIIKVDDEQRYTIKEAPIIVKCRKTDIDGELAYDYDKLNAKNQTKYSDIKRTFLKGENGFYYQQAREYNLKKKTKKNSQTK